MRGVSNLFFVGIENRKAFAPRIVGVSCNSLCILVNDGNDVALQVLQEVVGSTIVENTAYGILIIVERNERVVTPDLTEDLGAVEGIGMENTVYLLACSDAVGVVGILNVVKLFKLPPLFPS